MIAFKLYSSIIDCKEEIGDKWRRAVLLCSLRICPLVNDPLVWGNDLVKDKINVQH